MDKIHTFEKENTISFSNWKSLMHFVSEYVAFLYKKHCEFWKTTADEAEERDIWDERIKRDVPKLEKTLRRIMGRKRYFKRDINITSKSILLREAFKEAKIYCNPQDCIPFNVEYVINGLVFRREVKSPNS